MVDERCLPKPGAIVAGKYEILRAVGGGGMGVVFEARHLRLQRRVAIKFLRPELVTDEDAVARFEREGRHAAELTSIFAARVVDVDAMPDGVPYIVTEYLDGNNLEDELRARGPLPTSEAVGYVLSACSAIAEAHGLGIVHRDLKPANIFLAWRGAERVVKVVDFGISKAMRGDDLDLTSTGMIVGSPRYMSPEQIVDAKHTDPRSDIWSLGIVLYRLLTDQYPFAAENAMELAVEIVTSKPVPITTRRENLPPVLVAAVMRALDKDPARRFPTVQDFARTLAPFGTMPQEPEADSIKELRVESLSRPPKAASGRPVLPSTTGFESTRVDKPAAAIVQPSAAAVQHDASGVGSRQGRPVRRVLVATAAVGALVLAVVLTMRPHEPAPAQADAATLATTSDPPRPQAAPHVEAEAVAAATTLRVDVETPPPIPVDAGHRGTGQTRTKPPRPPPAPKSGAPETDDNPRRL